MYMYLKLFWYKVFVHYKLKSLDFVTDFVLIFHVHVIGDTKIRKQRQTVCIS